MGTELRVFISSPANVAAERAIAAGVVEEIDRELHEVLDVRVTPYLWERDRPTTDTLEQVHAELDRADLVIVIFATELGSASPQGGTKSFTVLEYERALQLRARRSAGGSPDVWLYFRDLTKSHVDDPGPKLKRLLDFRKRTGKIGWRPYASEDTFGPIFRGHFSMWAIARALAKIRDSGTANNGSTHRRREAFHQFLDLPSQPDQRTYIVYPPQNEEHHTRSIDLLPSVRTEDFQAIEAIRRAYVEAGEHLKIRLRPKSFASDAEDFADANKVLLCLRNDLAINLLERLPNEHNVNPRFSFANVAAAPVDRRLLWRNAGRELTVQSPLHAYLEQQHRSGEETSRVQRVAVDYGVLARYKIRARGHAPSTMMFLMGLRGLGTWGAAAYLLNKVPDLSKAARTSRSFERLVRVEYSNSGIASLEDVSQRDQAYFDEQCSPEFIHGVIEGAQRRWQ